MINNTYSLLNMLKNNHKIYRKNSQKKKKKLHNQMINIYNTTFIKLKNRYTI